jgi:hypothetical protein
VTIKRILVNRRAIETNAEAGRVVAAVYTLFDGDTIQHGNGMTVLGPCVFKYDPTAAAEYGRRVWVETTSPVVVMGDPLPEDVIIPDRQCDECDSLLTA